jgi:transcriptional regulator with XRE-family HTH domain
LEQAQRFSGRRLQRLRESRNWSVEHIASRTGIPVPAIHDLEQGFATPTGEHLTRLSKTFLIPVDRFLIDKVNKDAQINLLTKRIALLEEKLARLEALKDAA